MYDMNDRRRVSRERLEREMNTRMNSANNTTYYCLNDNGGIIDIR